MKDKKKRKSIRPRTPPYCFRRTIAAAGVLFIAFNLYLIHAIKSDARNVQLPHNEIHNFTIDINKRIKRKFFLIYDI